MAKENIATFYGQVQMAPKIYTTKEGVAVRALFYIKVIRRHYSSDVFRASNNTLYFDAPIIVTMNERMIKVAATLKKGDMVDIKGVLTTKEVTKSSICPECKEKNTFAGVSSFITPIYICRREQELSDDEGITLLKERNEISNTIINIGSLCRNPEKVEGGKTSCTQYQLAVNRKYHIKEDDPDKKTDYPWVKVYGNQADMDADVLHTGSLVYINGCLQTRVIKRNVACEHCECEYPYEDRVSEIVPYSVEYLNNCDIPDKSNSDE